MDASFPVPMPAHEDHTHTNLMSSICNCRRVTTNGCSIKIILITNCKRVNYIPCGESFFFMNCNLAYRKLSGEALKYNSHRFLVRRTAAHDGKSEFQPDLHPPSCALPLGELRTVTYPWQNCERARMCSYQLSP